MLRHLPMRHLRRLRRFGASRGYSPAAGLMSMALLALLAAMLLAGCSVTGGSQGSQTQPAPTITAPPIDNTAPSHQTLTIVGAGAIKPHLSGVPAFTADDMKQYLAGRPIVGPDHGAGQPSIALADFLTCADIDRHVGGAVSQMLSGCGRGTRYGFVLETGAFAFAGPGGGPHSSAQLAFVLFDPASGDLLMFGSATNHASTATPTPTPTPHVALALKPQSTIQPCADSTTVLPAITLTLDSTGSNAPVSWSVTISDTVGKSGVVWASASPTSGTIGAGGTAQVSVTPVKNICSLSQNVVPDATYHVVVHYGSGQQVIFSDLTHSPPPP